MKLSFVIAVILIIISLFCFTKYAMIGSYVAADGTVVEPFYLIWFGFISGAGALFFGILGSVIFLANKKSKK